MDDFQIVLYIIFAIIYVLSRVLKSRKKAGEQSQRPISANKQEESPKSFEDLLREFTGEEVEEEPVESVEKQPKPIQNQRVELSDTEIEEKYNKSVREARKYEPLEKTKVRHDIEYKRFAAFDHTDRNLLLEELEKDLSSLDGMKKAVLYKEILERKY